MSEYNMLTSVIMNEFYFVNPDGLEFEFDISFLFFFFFFFLIQLNIPFKIISAHMRRANQ